MQETQEIVENIKAVFNYEKFKYKKLKKFDGKELNQELMDELQSVVEGAVEYKHKNEVK
jgi:hypothetical protein